MILVPWQDIPLPDGPPSEENIANTGEAVINWVMLFPTLIVALVATAIIHHLWSNNSAFRMMVMVILAVVVTLMVMKAI